MLTFPVTGHFVSIVGTVGTGSASEPCTFVAFICSVAFTSASAISSALPMPMISCMWVGSSFWIASSNHLFVTVGGGPPFPTCSRMYSSTARRAIPCAKGGTRRILTSASGAHDRPAWPSSSIHGMSSGRTPVTPTRSKTHQVFRLGSKLGVFDAMGAVTAEDEQRRLDLVRPLHDHLEWLANEDLRFERDIGELPRHDLGALEIRLAELEQPFVDDVVVQLFLLFELEHLRRLIRQHVLDVVEDDVVILDVERAAHVQRRAELMRQFERRFHRLVAVGRAVHTHEETPAGERLLIANDQHVFLDAVYHEGTYTT